MENFKYNTPLQGSPWGNELTVILKWLNTQPKAYQAFIFDMCLSLAYATVLDKKGLRVYLSPSCPFPYNACMPFINLCPTCYHETGKWVYLKAAKPQSGVIGKLSSELILFFITHLLEDFPEVYSVGGTADIDAILIHKTGKKVFAEVKAAPLLTYPLLFSVPNSNQLPYSVVKHIPENTATSLYLHSGDCIPLGNYKELGWPFLGLANFVQNMNNQFVIDKAFKIWQYTKKVYTNKDRSNMLFYLANASGRPPKEIKEKFNWPNNEAVSDGKTSVGLDRTDDIKKAIYQALKIKQKYPNVHTALIANLPALRHGSEYLKPFENIKWAEEQAVNKELREDNLHYIFDCLITLTESLIRL